jgi:N-acetyl-1-D-myo-inositol-2-amino-2-deoxy-alpha-D-glucopyranoside deacetylase
MTAETVQSRRTLVFSPHPDDESLALGGTLFRLTRGGSEVRVVYSTCGENNGLAQRFVERRLRLDPEARNRWGARRRDEAVAALGNLGVAEDSIRFLHFTDGSLEHGADGCEASLVAAVRAQISEFQPDLILSPSVADLHGDHRATGRAVRAAMDPAAGASLYEFMVHGKAQCIPVVRIRLSPEEAECKRRAILCHPSQMSLSRRRFLAFVTAEESLYPPARARPIPFLGLKRLLEVLQG